MYDNTRSCMQKKTPTGWMNMRMFFFANNNNKEFYFNAMVFSAIVPFRQWMGIEKCAQTQCTSGTPFFYYIVAVAAVVVDLYNTIDGIKQLMKERKKIDIFFSVTYANNFK